ncbi:MAG: cytochrome c [Candidatus Eremiobacteraeota bacterium]|nr:cytochrome c [Candidatus Eremiobacteraeota bacterium]
MRYSGLAVGLFGGVLALCGSAIPANMPPPADPNAGAKLVSHNGCMGCHGAKFQGGLGPKLFGIEHKLAPGQISDFIKHPRAPMPDFGFTDAQINDVVAYLSNLDGGTSGAPVITLDPSTPKDHAKITVRFTGATPEHVTVRVSMQMGTTSHHSESDLHPTKDAHVRQGDVRFLMGGAWVLTLIYDDKHVDMPLNVAGGM